MSVHTASLFFALLTVLANAFVVVMVASRSARGWFRERFGASSIGLAWAVAVVATLGSLYYSEVVHLPPCNLCWYQRIAMYPLVVVLGVAALRSDRGVRRYALPVVAVGAALSVYHYQLERFPSQGGLACFVDAPCTTVWVWRFHYISIPFMALSAFALIATLLLLAGRPDMGEGSESRSTTSKEVPR
jgi:disulfide bond formation protein DsbB